MTGDRKVVFFDGGCLLCSGVVRWCHRSDRQGVIWYAALDSVFAEEQRDRLGLPSAGESAETFAFWDGSAGKVYFRSDGALALLRALGGFWKALGVVLSVFPLSVRDWGYRLIARNRYRWFGSSETCPLPPGSLRDRVLA